MDDQTFNKPVGLMVQSCYLPVSTRSLTVTSEGSAVVWEVLKQNGMLLLSYICIDVVSVYVRRSVF